MPTFSLDLLDGFFYPLASLLAAALATAALVPLVRKLAVRFGAIDDPKGDDRRIHKKPIPRWGGIAIILGVVIALLAIIPAAYPWTLFPPYLVGMLALGALIAVMGAWDDKAQFSARIQILYILGAGIAIQLFAGPNGTIQIQGVSWPLFSGSGEWIEFPAWVAFPLTAIYIFLVTKTMDTIDGVDGLAGGIAGIAAATIAVIAVLEQQPRVALVAAAIAGACLGFLPYNYNPAKIFMGTAGSQFLGFALACLSIVGALKTAAALALVIPILIFGVPIIDLFIAFTRRLLNGSPVTKADKRHTHHILLGIGLTQRQTVWVLYVAALVLAAIAITLVKMVS